MTATSNPTELPTTEPENTQPNLGERLEPFVSAPGDDEETRHRKVQFVFLSVLVVPAGLMWGALYFAYGERLVATIPLAYVAFTLVDVPLLLLLKRYELFRRIQQFLILVLPFALHLSLGGFVGSSVVILWSFLAVLTGVLFGGIPEARWWFVAYVAVILLAAALQPQLAIENQLPIWLVTTFFVLNVATVSSVAFVVLKVFVTDRRRLREIEVAYLSQEVMLRQAEKMATVGRLAAGVAHELNNPAAATHRAAEQLGEAVTRLGRAHIDLEVAGLPAAGRELLRELEEHAQTQAAQATKLDAKNHVNREANVERWLDEHGVADSWKLAPEEQGRLLRP